jgi:hypothetical protein
MNVNNFSSFYIDFGAHVYGYAGSFYVHLWFLLIFWENFTWNQQKRMDPCYL